MLALRRDSEDSTESRLPVGVFVASARSADAVRGTLVIGMPPGCYEVGVMASLLFVIGSALRFLPTDRFPLRQSSARRRSRRRKWVWVMRNTPRESTEIVRAPSARPRAGTILRHWTTNDLVFMGKATTTASDMGDWGLADARRRNLIASKLKSLAGGAGTP